MSIASTYTQSDKSKLLFEEELWESFFEEAVKDSSETADSLAHVMFKVLEAISEGHDGVDRAANTLKYGIEWVYRFTGAHRAGFRAYLFYLAGMMLIPDYPEELMNGAIERAIQHAQDQGDDDPEDSDRYDPSSPEAAADDPSNLS